MNRRTLIRSLALGSAAALVVPSTSYFFFGESAGWSRLPMMAAWRTPGGFIVTDEIWMERDRQVINHIVLHDYQQMMSDVLNSSFTAQQQGHFYGRSTLDDLVELQKQVPVEV